jgi:anthranilate/para-aminobenzoate synthase component I
MIRELGPLPRALLLAAAGAADREGRGVALLQGIGWGGIELALDPVEEHRVPIFAGAFDAVTDRLDRIGKASTEPGWNGRPAAARYIGYVAYEAARSIERPGRVPRETRALPTGAAMVLRRFSAVARRDEQTGIVAVEGDDDAAIDRLVTLLTNPQLTASTPTAIELAPVDSDDAHHQRIVRALALIASGDVYQVNVARTFAGHTRALATELLTTLLTRTSAAYGAAIDFGDHALASSSPELFLDVDPHRQRVITAPIKGTRPRGDDARTDELQRRALDADPKERAELTMVIDLERNDLGRVARVGSVRVPAVPRIETSRTVHHRVADVCAELREGVGLGAVFAAAFPSGSVTGAPKVRAMEVIAQLERDRRGIYCGAVLRVGRDGHARAAMAIRTIVVDKSRSTAVYQAGGGIVADSDPHREVTETRWKARQVLRPGSRGSAEGGSRSPR